MKIHELTLDGARAGKRVGRGIGSGRGKTAGRGTKGQNARTGGGVRPGFEGGQNPLAKRLPKKRGFSAPGSLVYQVVNLGSLDRLSAGAIDNVALATAGLIRHADRPTKLLGNGRLTKALTVRTQAASAAAVVAIEAAGGKFEATALARPVAPAKSEPSK